MKRYRVQYEGDAAGEYREFSAASDDAARDAARSRERSRGKVRYLAEVIVGPVDHHREIRMKG